MRGTWRALPWLAALTALVSLASAAPPPAGPARGPRFKLTVTPRRPAQGEVLVAALESPLDWRVSATFDGEPVPMEPQAPGRPAWAVVGIDVDARPGPHPLSVTLRSVTGAERRINLDVTVVAGRFNVQRLRVDPDMATPPAAVTRRIEEEARLVAQVTSRVTERRFEGPFQRPVPGVVTAGFGGRRVFNGVSRNPHAGVDLRAAQGTPVQAMAGGTVVLARDFYYAGRCVHIDHGMGLFSHYAHLSKQSVREGQTVRAGEVIGRSGRTGRVTGPHLHWGVVLRRARVDPLGMVDLEGPFDPDGD